MKKRVLVTCLYPNEANPVFALSIAKELVKLNFEVYAIIEKSTINKAKWQDLLGEDKIEEININNVTKKYNKYTKYFNAARYILLNSNHLFRHINKVCFDYVFFTFYHHWNDILLSKVKSKCNVLFLHDPLPHSGEAKRRLGEQKKQANRMDCIVVLSKKFIPIVQKEYGIDLNKIVYMPHGSIDYNTGEDKLHVRFNHNKGLHFLFFGRITQYKGIDILIKAFELVSQKIEDCQLTIAGNGDFSQYDRLLNNSNRVSVINRYIDDSEIPNLFLKDNTVVVLPYKDATQSGVISIATTYGNPVIATNTGGLREQLNNGAIGLFVNPDNTQELSDIMLHVNNHRDLLEKESEKMIRFQDSLRWDVIVKNLICELSGGGIND